MDRWVGKTAVVTGASAGIGAAIAVSLANADLRVVGLARRPTLIDELKSKVTGKGEIHARECDISKTEEIAKTFKWIEDTFGGIDVLVNNAAVLHAGSITDVGEDTINEDSLLSTMDINVKGVISCTIRAVSSMKKRGFDGHIININSVAGHYIPSVTLMNVYPSSKHAITAFTASLNNELAEFKNKIKTTSISPGLVKTEMVSRGLPADFKDALQNAPALHPQDVADAVMYSLSTPPNVNINELTIMAVTDKRL